MKLETLQKLRLGGMADAWALVGIGASVVATSPIVHSAINPMIFYSMAFFGTGYMLDRIYSSATDQRALPTKLDMLSSDLIVDPADAKHRKDLILLGYTTDKGLPLYITYELMTRHLLILGASGSGKTVIGSTIMRQHIANGGGLTFVDGKMSLEDFSAIYAMASECGRAHDVRVINPGNPKMSNTYNPILHGDPDEIGSRILSLIPDASASPGADYYRSSALQAVTTLVRGIQACGKAFHFYDLSILLSNPKAMMSLQRMVNAKGASLKSTDHAALASIDDIKLFLNRFVVKTKKGSTMDLSKMKELLGGIAGRMHSFGTGEFGEVMNTYSPEVNLYDDIMNNRIIYVMLPTMGKSEAATNFAKMFLGDYRTAVSWIQALPLEERPDPPHFNFFDEAGSYFNQTFPRLMEQGRSARQILCPAAQVPANFDAISEDMGQMVTGNTFFKVWFKLGTFEAAEAAANYIGMVKQQTRSVSDSDSMSDSAQNETAPQSSSSSGQGLTIAAREEEAYLVHPDKLLSLQRGQCIVHCGDGSVYDIRVPMFSIDKKLLSDIGNCKVNHRDMPSVEGLNYSRRIAEFVDEIADEEGD